MSNSLRRLLTVIACAGTAAASSSALAGGIGFGFTANTFNPGAEALTVTWSSDPGAVFTVSPAGPGTGWNISMAGSGHATFGGGAFAFEAGQTMTWADPINAGMYSNLTYINDTTWHLQILSPVAANTYNAGFGVFANGVSIFAGSDADTAPVFAAVSIVPTPGAAAALGLGGLAAVRRRRAAR